MLTVTAPQSLAEKFPQLAPAPVPVKTKTVNAEGAITGENEDLGVMHAPDPVGHFMLVALPKVELSKLLITPDAVTERERAASVIGTVIALGPDCYKDPEPIVPDIVRQALVAGAPVSVSLIAPRPRFPSGPWCKAGDTVLFSRYAGKRFTITNRGAAIADLVPSETARAPDARAAIEKFQAFLRDNPVKPDRKPSIKSLIEEGRE